VLALLGFIAAIFAGLLELLGGHGKAVTILLIIGLALVCAEVAFGWHRAGHTYRRVRA
jgi:uncharacterized membrane protein